MEHYRETGACTLTLEADRYEYQWRTVLLTSLVFTCPLQEAHCEEQGVGSALLQCGTGSSIELGQAHIHFTVGESNKNLSTLQRIFSMTPANVLTLALLIKLFLTWICSIHEVRARQKLQRLPTSKNVFESSGIRRLKFKCLFPVLEVEQVVTQREVEQLALPTLQPVFRAEFGNVFNFNIDDLIGDIVSILNEKNWLIVRVGCHDPGNLSFGAG
ncbi:hypothetical protein D3C76_717370 [compost metagenome]